MHSPIRRSKILGYIYSYESYCIICEIKSQSCPFSVLVQRPNQVKITDFGLAKLLNCDAEEIQLDEEKVGYNQSTTPPLNCTGRWNWEFSKI